VRKYKNPELAQLLVGSIVILTASSLPEGGTILEKNLGLLIVILKDYAEDHLWYISLIRSKSKKEDHLKKPSWSNNCLLLRVLCLF